MRVKAIMPVRNFNLVVPLAGAVIPATDMRTTDTVGTAPEWSGAVSPASNLGGDVDSTNGRSTPRIPTMPGCRTSTTAIRTTTTRATPTGRVQSADQYQRRHADFSFEELVRAYLDCRQTKRNKPTALAFEQNLERNLCQLHDDLLDGSYQPGASICFVITRPKCREVWAASFRDRVVHHLFYNRIAPRFHAGFLADSCACIPGRGTLYGARRLETKVRSITENWSRPAFYLKLDLANFFVSIDKRIVRDLLAARISEPWWMRLAETILFHDPRQGAVVHSSPRELARIPAHKSLFNQPAHLGLPIGNLSSQFFANVLLDALDQHCKHDLRARHYIRYVDDFILLHESPQWLNAALANIEAWLPAVLRLRLNPAKTILQPVDRGVDFVGQVIRPWRRTTRRRTFNDAISRIEAAAPGDLYASANSYFGLFRQATHSHADRAHLANVLRQRGYSVNGKLTQTYRRAT